MITMYGGILTIAILAGTLWTYKRLVAVGFDSDDVDTMILIAAPSALVGARLYHVATDWYLYAQHPADILKIWHGGLGSWGAVIGGLLSVYLFIRIKHFSFNKLLGEIAAPLMLVFAVGRWGNVFNNELLPYEYYESFVTINMFILILALEKKVSKEHRYRLFLGASIGYMVVRAFLEIIRLEPRFWLLTVNQYVSIMLALTLSIGWFWYEKKHVE